MNDSPRAAQGGVQVGEVMTTKLVTLDRNEHLRTAHDLMTSERIRHLVIVDEDGNLVGVLSQRDLFAGALAAALGYGEAAQERVMETVRIKEVMATDVHTVTADMPVAEAADLMRQNKIGCLPVVDGEKPVGIITEGTFVTLVATGALG